MKVHIFPKTGSLSTGHVIMTPNSWNGVSALPNIVIQHGIAQRGDGSAESLQGLASFFKEPFANIERQCDKYGIAITAPQLPNGLQWQNNYVTEGMTLAQKEFPIKMTQKFLMGVSLGGGGVYRFASLTLSNAQQFAAIVPICAVFGLISPSVLSLAGVPIWAFHSIDDEVVKYSEGFDQFAQIKAVGTPKAPIKFTTYRGIDHTSTWCMAWSDSPFRDGEQGNLFEWLLRNEQGKQSSPVVVPPPPPPPSIQMKANVDYTPGQTTAVLDATGSTGMRVSGDWKDISWAVVSAPGGAYWDIWDMPNMSKMGEKVKVKNLAPGEWKFRATGSDGKGNSVYADTPVVTVTKPALQPLPPKLTIPIPDGAKEIALYEDWSYKFK